LIPTNEERGLPRGEKEGIILANTQNVARKGKSHAESYHIF
jgi:hypothetical protein